MARARKCPRSLRFVCRTRSWPERRSPRCLPACARAASCHFCSSGLRGFLRAGPASTPGIPRRLHKLVQRRLNGPPALDGAGAGLLRDPALRSLRARHALWSLSFAERPSPKSGAAASFSPPSFPACGPPEVLASRFFGLAYRPAVGPPADAAGTLSARGLSRVYFTPPPPPDPSAGRREAVANIRECFRLFLF